MVVPILIVVVVMGIDTLVTGETPGDLLYIMIALSISYFILSLGWTAHNLTKITDVSFPRRSYVTAAVLSIFFSLSWGIDS